MCRYMTIEGALAALNAAELDAIADHGEEGALAAYRDLVDYVAEDCSPEVAEELRRRCLSR